MKYFLTLLLLGAFTSFGQMLSGDLKDSGRKKISNTPYILESHTTGFVAYEVTVNNEGNVTAARLVANKTTVRSTPARMRAGVLRTVVLFATKRAAVTFPSLFTVTS